MTSLLFLFDTMFLATYSATTVDTLPEHAEPAYASAVAISPNSTTSHLLLLSEKHLLLFL